MQRVPEESPREVEEACEEEATSGGLHHPCRISGTTQTDLRLLRLTPLPYQINISNVDILPVLSICTITLHL